jgi:hypothetical protein
MSAGSPVRAQCANALDNSAEGSYCWLHTLGAASSRLQAEAQRQAQHSVRPAINPVSAQLAATAAARPPDQRTQQRPKSELYKHAGAVLVCCLTLVQCAADGTMVHHERPFATSWVYHRVLPAQTRRLWWVSISRRGQRHGGVHLRARHRSRQRAAAGGRDQPAPGLPGAAGGLGGAAAGAPPAQGRRAGGAPPRSKH